MARKQSQPPQVAPKEFRSAEEVERAIAKLERRIKQLEAFDSREAILNKTGADGVVASDVRETIREVFGTNSPEFQEHEHLQLWGGPMFINMPSEKIAAGVELGRIQTIGIVRGLTNRLKEKLEEFGANAAAPATYFDKLNLHPRIRDVARDLFLDGHHWEAVFAASKALVNMVKERSGRHDLDGAPLMRTVFSRKHPILAFNELAAQTDEDEQEGMMHLFEGVILGIRNPGGHSFPEGPAQRAIEYISLLSLLAYRAQEAKKQKVRAPD
jgi:uncharacterized protein (TIGR02391 family)